MSEQSVRQRKMESPCGARGVWLVLAVAVTLTARAAETYSIADYFPLRAASTWTLQDTDGEPADDEGFSWIVVGAAPQAIGPHSAWPVETDTVAAADSREGDRQFWTYTGGQTDLGLCGLYEKAGASPLAANQTIVFSQPLRFGTAGMAVGWTATTTGTAQFRVTVPVFGTIPVNGTVASVVTLAQHLDSVDTPLGVFHDVIVLTADVTGTAYGFSLSLSQSTLFLARGIGLVRSGRTLNPASTQAQAISGGQLGGVPIAPLPPTPVAGITVQSADGETSEGGDTATATLVLNTAPTHPLTVTLTSDAPSEGVFADAESSATFVFSPTDWDVPQVVHVLGVDDDDWDGHRVFHLDLAMATADPAYAALDPAAARVTLTNRDNEILDIGDYFVLTQGSTWHYQWFDEEAGPVPGGAEMTWTVEEQQPIVHGTAVTAIRTDATDSANPLSGAANFWSIDATGRLLLHGIRLPASLEQEVEYLGGTYHVLVPAQTVVLAAPLVAGTRGMVTHQPVTGSTTANVQVSGLPFVTALPVNVSARAEVLGMRPRKRTPLGAFLNVPELLLTISVEALGESVQDQGGILFLAKGLGVVCQNAAEALESPLGLALSAGRSGVNPIVADDPADRRLRLALRLNHGWNLVSLPFRPLTSSSAAVFGDAIVGRVWEVRGRALAEATAVGAGRAYWVFRNPAAGTADPLSVPITGTPETATTRSAMPGWVLAGPISVDPAALLTLPLPAAGRAGDAEAALVRTAWTWGARGYVPVHSVPAGLGVWLFVERPGTLDLAPAPPLKSPGDASQPAAVQAAGAP